MADTFVDQRPLVGAPSLTTIGTVGPLGPHQLPAVPDEITPEWLSSVLGVDVKSIQLTTEIPGTATKVFITAKNKGMERRLCIKGGFNPAFIQQMPWIVMIYQREVEFFNRIAPKLTGMDLPQSLWAGHTPTQGIVIMEDLAARGCEFGNPMKTWPVRRVRKGIEQLAALHAKTWGVQPKEYPWLTSDYDQAILTMMGNYSAVVNGPDRPTLFPYLKDQERFTAVLKKHYQSRNPKFQCLLHGDAHLGNTYIDNGAPRFLDWQMIHIGSAFHDVAYFIGGALSVQDRRAHEWRLVDHYLLCLARFGIRKNFRSTDKDVRNEYRKGFLAGVGWLMCPYEMQPRDCVHAMAARYNAALDDHKVLDLVESLPEPKPSAAK